MQRDCLSKKHQNPISHYSRVYRISKSSAKLEEKQVVPDAASTPGREFARFIEARTPLSR